jgi:multicomponent Na+:H+ antiporter subunit G
MSVTDVLSVVLIVCGTGFFFAGTVGLLRFPDIYTRLHALTKADNVGLGLVVLGLVLQADSLSGAGKLILIWLLVLVASAVGCHLIARSARNRGIQPWKR